MTSPYRQALALAGSELITYIGLLNDEGVELKGGTPAYRRQPATWAPPVDGRVLLETDLVFDVPPGTVIGGWRGYSGVSGGINYGGSDLMPEAYLGQGHYRLLAELTGIDHFTP